MYTHYSLFIGNSVVADFKKLPEGGLQEVVAPFSHHTNCIGIDRGVIHPNGDQLSIGIRTPSDDEVLVILYSPNALRDQFVELRAEGNTASAAKAKAALQERSAPGIHGGLVVVELCVAEKKGGEA